MRGVFIACVRTCAEFVGGATSMTLKTRLSRIETRPKNVQSGDMTSGRLRPLTEPEVHGADVWNY